MAVLWSHSILESHPVSSPEVVSPASLQLQQNQFNLLEDLWPDDFQHEGFYHSLHSCTFEDDNCRPEYHPSKRILLLHPPGSIGTIFVDFMKDVVFRHSLEEDASMVIVPTSHIPTSLEDDFSYTHIIRFATMPLLLAIGDALLSVAGEQSLSLNDVQEVARLLLNWHCTISEIADTKTIPTMTITLQSIAEDFSETHVNLREFLSALEPSEDLNPEEIMEAESIANSLSPLIDMIQDHLKVLDESLKDNVTTDGDLERIVNKIMDSHLNGRKCKIVDPRNHHQSLDDNMSVRIQQLMQKGDATMDRKLCRDKTNSLFDTLACKELTDPFTAAEIKLKKRAPARSNGRSDEGAQEKGDMNVEEKDEFWR